MPPILASAQAVTAPGGAFTDIGQNQYNHNYTGPNVQLVVSPELSPHFDLAKFISRMAPQTQTNQGQIQALSASIGTLLAILDAEYQSGRLLEARTSLALEKLCKYAEITVMQKMTAKPMTFNQVT
jgi:hypothetical protein